MTTTEISPPTTAREALERGRQAFLEHEWCRAGVYGQDESGRDLRVDEIIDGKACSLCAVGALFAGNKAHAVSERHPVGAAWTELLRASSAGPDGHFLLTFNDTKAESKDDIVAVYNRAIEAVS